MKRFLLYAMSAIMLFSCSDEYDDTGLKNDLNGLKDRVAALESTLKAMNTDIASMRSIVTALQGRDYVTGITELDDKSGYTLTFEKGGSIVIKHGKNGTNGKDAPIVGIDLFEGAYYWTLTTGDKTTWLTDDSGNKLKVTGQDGKSAYELAVEKGYEGSLEEWFESLKGSNGKSAYELAVEGGYSGSEEEWLASLNGTNGNNGKSAYELAVEQGYEGTEAEWIASLKGSDGNNGKSAYELAVEKGYEGTIDEWLTSLNGTNGEAGKDGKTPILGVDAEGYWTIDKGDGNGVARLKDAQGKDVKAVGADGTSFFEDVTHDDDYVYLTLSGEQKIAVPRRAEYVFEVEGTNNAIQLFKHGETKTYNVAQSNIEDFTIYSPNGWKAKMEGNTLTVTAPVKENTYADMEGEISIIVTTKQGQCAIVKVRVEINTIIDIPDANFKAYLVENFDTDKDGEISFQETEAVTEINCRGKNISSLEGIEYFTTLTTLDCSHNQLTSLDVSKNNTLTKLSCIDNQLTNLDISKNTALTILYCSNNSLTNLDVNKNTALTQLGCSSNQLTSLDVSKNRSLTGLTCAGNQLRNLDVSNNTALTELWCPNNQLTNFDVHNNKALTLLGCSSNQLTSLDVSNNTALTELYCDRNQLTSLDVSKNIALIFLSCYDNSLTDLDVTDCISLTLMECYDNLLTDLAVNNNTALTSLSCSNNKLTTLEIDGCTALTGLSCDNNQLTTLEIDGCTVLTYLSCSNNKLTTLDVSNTSLGNSNHKNPLDCGNMPTLHTLYLKGINVN